MFVVKFLLLKSISYYDSLFNNLDITTNMYILKIIRKVKSEQLGYHEECVITISKQPKIKNHIRT